MSLFGDKSEKIRKWGEKGKKDKLVEMLNKGEPKYRAEAATALGKVQNSEVINVLISTIRDSDPVVRANAIESLGNLKAKNAEEHIRRAIESETVPEIKEKAQTALEKVRHGAN